MIGKKAPAIRATAVVNGNEIVQDFTLGQYEGKKYVVLFFYPMDFTFVCPTELHAFQEKLGEFEARGVQVVGCSVDSEYSHLAWLGQPRNRGGIVGGEQPRDKLSDNRRYDENHLRELRRPRRRVSVG